MKNYARHIEKHNVESFENELPWRFADRNLAEWAFWFVPPGQNPSRFEGKLVGEDPSQRCIRMNHVPKSKYCDVCKNLPRNTGG